MLVSESETGGFIPGDKSALLFERAERVFPGGLTRSTIDRQPHQYYISHGKGAFLYDVDGNRLLDLNNNFTTLIHGHAFAPVVDAVTKVIRDGSCFSNPTAFEVDLAELICSRVPAVDKVRFVNTGTEAVMFAIKAARAFTGRPAIAKIEGAYHGAYDWAEVGQTGTPQTWGSPDHPTTVPYHPGQPASVLQDVVILRLNDVEGMVRRIEENADRLACILVDPMASRAGLIEPDREFLDALVATARKFGILVIADEVLNFRQGFEGASAKFGLDPDLVVMGKIIGGGFPIGAIGGSEQVMSVFGSRRAAAPLPQGGTFSANPVSMVAGYVSMSAMTREVFDRLDYMGHKLRTRLRQAIEATGSDFSVTGSASLFRIHPTRQIPTEYRQAYLDQDGARTIDQLGEYFKTKGILLPKGAAACLSTAMSDEDISFIATTFHAFLTSGRG